MPFFRRNDPADLTQQQLSEAQAQWKREQNRNKIAKEKLENKGLASWGVAQPGNKEYHDDVHRRTNIARQGYGTSSAKKIKEIQKDRDAGIKRLTGKEKRLAGKTQRREKTKLESLADDRSAAIKKAKTPAEAKRISKSYDKKISEVAQQTRKQLNKIHEQTKKQAAAKATTAAKRVKQQQEQAARQARIAAAKAAKKKGK